MNVIETRIRGLLRQAVPLAAKISKDELRLILDDVFGTEFQEPDPPAAIRYEALNGMMLTVRPELRGSRYYWFVNKQHNGRKHRLYIAPAGQLSRELIENAAIHIAGTVGVVSHEQ